MQNLDEEFRLSKQPTLEDFAEAVGGRIAGDEVLFDCPNCEFGAVAIYVDGKLNTVFCRYGCHASFELYEVLNASAARKAKAEPKSARDEEAAGNGAHHDAGGDDDHRDHDADRGEDSAEEGKPKQRDWDKAPPPHGGIFRDQPKPEPREAATTLDGKVHHIEDDPAQARDSALYQLSQQAKDLVKFNPLLRDNFDENREECAIQLKKELMLRALGEDRNYRFRGLESLTETDVDDEMQRIVDAYVPVPAERVPAVVEDDEDEVELPPKVLSLGQVYDLVDEWDRQPWIWDKILPHASLSLISGKAESGKSTLIYGLIYAIVKGEEFLGRRCQRGPVLYLAGDPVSEIVAGKTFKAMGLMDGEDPIHVVAGALVGHANGIKYLRQWVRKIRPILIVGDTMAATVSLDTDKYGKSYEAQQPLAQIARRYSPNFLMAHHSQKSAIESYGVVDAALGSVGVGAVASTRMATKCHTRGKNRYYTFEMSSLRLGVPIEGEVIVSKDNIGRISLGRLWSDTAEALDQETIRKVLVKKPLNMGIAERTLWAEVFPKPKWAAFKPALEAMVESGEVLRRDKNGRGGGKVYLLASNAVDEGERPEPDPLKCEREQGQGRLGGILDPIDPRLR
jgi:hypothetical protein